MATRARARTTTADRDSSQQGGVWRSEGVLVDGPAVFRLQLSERGRERVRSHVGLSISVSPCALTYCLVKHC